MIVVTGGAGFVAFVVVAAGVVSCAATVEKDHGMVQRCRKRFDLFFRILFLIYLFDSYPLAEIDL